MIKNISNLGKVLLSLSPTTSAGNPATIDGPPVYTTEVGDATTEDYINGPLEPNPGQVNIYKKWIVSGTNGPYKVVGKADADLGAGVRELEVIVEGEVTEPEASELGASIGDEVPK